MVYYDCLSYHFGSARIPIHTEKISCDVIRELLFLSENVKEWYHRPQWTSSQRPLDHNIREMKMNGWINGQASGEFYLLAILNKFE